MGMGMGMGMGPSLKTDDAAARNCLIANSMPGSGVHFAFALHFRLWLSQVKKVDLSHSSLSGFWRVAAWQSF
jgi:hypothetical protein